MQQASQARCVFGWDITQQFAAQLNPRTSFHLQMLNLNETTKKTRVVFTCNPIILASIFMLFGSFSRGSWKWRDPRAITEPCGRSPSKVTAISTVLISQPKIVRHVCSVVRHGEISTLTSVAQDVVYDERIAVPCIRDVGGDGCPVYHLSGCV